MKLRLEVHHNLDLLAVLVEAVAQGSILGSRVLCEGYVLAASLLHILCTSHELLDVEASAGDRQQAYWCQYGEAAIRGKNVGKTCRAHYRGTFGDGTQFDSSYDRGEPLEFVCGAGQMIRGFDAAVADMDVGQTVQVHLTPSEAYGEVNPEAIFTVEIARLPGSEALSVGEQVYLQNMYGQPLPVKVVAKDETTVTFDANHEMAGKELNFTIELVEVR